ncbi:hypothetical protein Tco_0952303 [Tanacetum coccineum]|uniref:Integrase, catalytic region, zinc finger, CCHC-type, peptidase aspartic, catalytic n=1 Tax=Tanacetum coccineum TaxID=301880 RepID=A0ABQ5DZG6_9ASTR
MSAIACAKRPIGNPTNIGDSIFQIPISVYYVEGLGHNLFSVGQFCDSDLEVAFRKHSCYVRDTDGVELLKVSVTDYYERSRLEQSFTQKTSAQGSTAERLLSKAENSNSCRGSSDNVNLSNGTDFRARTQSAPVLPYVPPTSKELEMLFQPMFDEVLQCLCLLILGAFRSQTSSQLESSFLSVHHGCSKVQVKRKTSNLQLTEDWLVSRHEDEIHEFDRLDVWELVPPPDSAMIIALKWIYKVKLDEYGDVLEKTGRLCGKGFRLRGMIRRDLTPLKLPYNI